MSDHPLRRLWQYSGTHRRDVVLATIWTVLNKLFDVMPELLIGLAVDVVVRGDNSGFGKAIGVENRYDQLTILAIANVVIWICESITDYLAAVRWRTLAQALQHDARLDAYRHVQGLELAWFEDRSTGGIASILSDDVNQLERFLDTGAQKIQQNMVNIVAVGAVFLFISPLLALLAFLPIPVIVFGSFRYQKRLEPLYTDVRERVGVVAGSLAANLSGIATIKAFTAEDREATRIEEQSEAYRQANSRAIRFSSAFVPLIRMAILTGFTLTLLIGGRAALDGTLAVGSFSILVFMTQRLLWPLTDLGEVFDQYQRAMASTRRILDLMAVPPAIVSGPLTLPAAPATVTFEDVRFSYATGQEVLRGLDVSIPAGQSHAIVGSTGAGKSTVVKLLLRFHDVSSGRVSVDGIDVRELDLSSLRGITGYVGQDVFLFDGTIRENVAYGRPEATDDQILEALRAAEAADIAALDAVVGERGQKLSGGQRQRLSLARAILRDPALLILDEATSAVDNETEAAIQRSLARVSQGRTTLIIAHRLSTVRHCDRIHVLEAGRVTEAGTHDELLEAGGLYAALWRVQTGEAVSA